MKTALFGAGGKMGRRLTRNLKDSAYEMLYVEVSEPGIRALREAGLEPTPQAEVLAAADAVILAVPDRLIGRIADEIVPALRPGAMVALLDPAAPRAGDLPGREDIAYFVTHPCHPPVFNEENDPEARKDYFGGVRARQNIVCALMQGTEADYARGEALAKTMFAPVMRAHRITVEQMAVLEPALAETVAASCLTLIREAMDEAVGQGVPEEAARDFLLGHLNIPLAILFGEVDSTFSDGAKLIMRYGQGRLFRPGWRELFTPESVLRQVRVIVNGKLPE
ncbi:MAG: semialdehyde dehydrogenase [Armatimonadetes bacterium]|nr:semialdehyde dehydrogenase [Armatimonadota bacterium]